ncbi:MAG: sugar ABC transporter permease [Lachnospiraceae bacterium]|jgi:D-xylose transport system permease protein|nr:sugar ABC transporter permease [Lachnospiraceae bacterium]
MTKNKKFDLFGLFYKNSLVVETVIIFVIFQILTKGTFMTVANMSNLLMQGATYSIIAITMCLVIITGNADLSAGRFLGMLGIIAAIVIVNHPEIPSWAALLLVYVIAIVAGLWHGFWVGYMKLPAFIITLATQLLFLGINQMLSGGRIYGPIKGIIAEMGGGYLPSVVSKNDTTLIVGALLIAAYLWFTISKERKGLKQGLYEKRWGKVAPKMAAICALAVFVTVVLYQHRGFAYAMLILLALALLISHISNNTKFGRYIYAIGGNKDAAALSGINVSKELLKLYVLHAVVVATAAMVCLGRLNSATTSTGNGYEFTAITGCVVGGTAITGGRGTVIGAVVGTMIMAALDNGMSLLNLDPSFQYIVRSAVLLFAISLDAFANNRKTKTVQEA